MAEKLCERTKQGINKHQPRCRRTDNVRRKFHKQRTFRSRRSWQSWSEPRRWCSTANNRSFELKNARKRLCTRLGSHVGGFAQLNNGRKLRRTEPRHAVSHFHKEVLTRCVAFWQKILKIAWYNLRRKIRHLQTLLRGNGAKKTIMREESNHDRSYWSWCCRERSMTTHHAWTHGWWRVWGDLVP